MNKYSLDASAILHAWDEYPIGNFPRLWEWLETRLQSKDIIILETAFDESDKDEACAKWLKDKGIKIDSINQEILDSASNIKNQLGIVDDAYDPKGVNENDVLITAHAQYIGCILITEESRQFILPENKKEYRIPAVCKLIHSEFHPSESCRFIDFIKASKL